MGRKCIVPNCTSGYKSNSEKVPLFAIPKNSLKEFTRIIPRKDRVLTEKDHVCAKHFQPECIIHEVKTGLWTYPLKVPKLQEGSVPTIFPNCPKYMSKNLPQKRREIVKHHDTQVKRRRPNSEAKTVQNSDAVETGEIANDTVDIRESPFDTLWRSHEVLSLPSSLWCVHLIPNSDNNLIAVTKLVPFNNNVLLEKKIVVNKNFEVDCYLFEHLTNLAQNIEISNIEQLKDFLIKVDNLSVCYGSFVREFFKSTVYYKDVYCQSWRHSKCEFLIQENVDLEHDFSRKNCKFCKKINISLRVFKTNKRNATHKKLIHRRKLQKRQKSERRLKNRLALISKKLQNFKEKIKEINEQDLSNKLDGLENLHSTQKILITECIKMCKYENKTTRRYTSDWLLICLLLHIKSPTTYKFLRNQEILPLPSIRTVKRYLSRVNLKCGLDNEFFEAFKLKMKTKTEFQRQGMLIFDEMQVRQCVNLNVKTMKLMGVEDFGEENENTSQSTEKCADHALVFMWSSLAENFSQPIAVYASKGATKGTCLAQLVLEVIRKLENSGALVHGVVSDGATTNRKMWTEFGISGKMHSVSNKTVHPMDDTRCLYFFSDAPHLIKCLRNRLLKSRALVTPDGGISWDYYKIMFELDTQPHNLRVCPKITEAHIRPTNMLKMRVRLATQIFSNSVADGLKFYQAHSSSLKHADITILFTKRINDMFDALNRRHPAEGIRKNSNDLKILQENLEYLNKWETMLSEQKITKEQFLTQSTAEGLRVSITSTLELTAYLLNNCKFQYVLTSKMNQDPLERFFGTIRQAGCSNDHPTMVTFLQLFRMLSVYKLLKPPKFGNCTVLPDMEDAPRSLCFDDFKAIFTGEQENRATHLQKIKDKLNNVSEGDDWDYDWDKEKDHEVFEYIIYYLTGFICRKVSRETSCVFCKKCLDLKNPLILPAVAELVTVKSRGGLNYSNGTVFNYFLTLEKILFKHINSVDVFEETIDEFLCTSQSKTLEFPCESHSQDIITKLILFYITMRVKQFYKRESQTKTKSFSNKKKESRLQLT